LTVTRKRVRNQTPTGWTRFEYHSENRSSFNAPQESIGLWSDYFFHSVTIRGLVFNGVVADGGSLVAGYADMLLRAAFSERMRPEAKRKATAHSTSAGVGVSSSGVIVVGRNRGSESLRGPFDDGD